jgi:uncharacterized membrane protein required for colicin V production
MLDIGILFILGLLALRGWYRGLLRSVVSLAVLVGGAFVAFTMSGALTGTVQGLTGLSHDPARMVASTVIFLVVSTGGAIASSVLHKGIRFLPGLTTINRIGGAGFAVVTGGLVLVLGLTLVSLLPANETLDRQFDESEIVSILTNPDGLPQRLLSTITGDRLPRAILVIEQLVGDRRLVVAPDMSQRIPASSADDIRLRPDLAEDVLELINRDRVGNNVSALALSGPLAQVAMEHASTLLTDGIVSFTSSGGTIADRLDRADILRASTHSTVVLAASPQSAVEGIGEQTWSLPVVADADVTKIGVGVASAGVLQVYVVIVSQ